MKTIDELAARVEALEAARDVPAPSIDPNTLYTARQAADRLGCSLANVYSLAAGGDMASVRVGAGKGGIRVLGRDVLAFVESRREGGPPPRMAFKHLKM